MQEYLVKKSEGSADEIETSANRSPHDLRSALAWLKAQGDLIETDKVAESTDGLRFDIHPAITKTSGVSPSACAATNPRA